MFIQRRLAKAAYLFYRSKHFFSWWQLSYQYLFQWWQSQVDLRLHNISPFQSIWQILFCLSASICAFFMFFHLLPTYKCHEEYYLSFYSMRTKVPHTFYNFDNLICLTINFCFFFFFFLDFVLEK